MELISDGAALVWTPAAHTPSSLRRGGAEVEHETNCGKPRVASDRRHPKARFSGLGVRSGKCTAPANARRAIVQVVAGTSDAMDDAIGADRTPVSSYRGRHPGRF